MTEALRLPLPLDFPPMEAKLVQRVPTGEEWLYEPKWDGFRCIAFKEGERVELQSKAGKPLGRYFPDLLEVIAALPPRRLVLDGELVIPVDGSLVFDELLLRIHPAESRVRKLAAAHPAHLIAFDLLVDERGRDRTALPLGERRALLETLFEKKLAGHPRLHLSPATNDARTAKRWLAGARGGLDGVMAKRLDLPYQSGDRTGMHKVKRLRSADCVVGGFRWSKAGGRVGSLLLGLHDDDGLLHHVGFCSALNAAARAEADTRLIPLRGGSGFSGRAPGGPSRWRTEGSGEWEPLRPEVVVEVQYDHFSGGRFRHGTRFLRWRPDKASEQCTLDQLETEGRSAMKML
jgi:ATP-dependent DNA ligase